MLKFTKSRALRLAGCLLLMLVALSLAFANAAPQALATAGPASPAGATTIYLPAVLNGPPPPNIFGVTMGSVSQPGLGLVTDTPTQWVRGPYIHWGLTEPSVGARNWAAGAPDSQILSAAQNNLELILAVSQGPSWAQQIAGKPCGPIRSDRFDEFGAFMRDAVARYSVAPYNVTYWEIWNEPDVDHTLVPANSPFGCWGNNADTYYGGGYYGDMLEVVVPMMRAANPNVKILIGGLLLDCNPDNPPTGLNCGPGRFMEGILRSGSAAFFDGISFHAYDYYGLHRGEYANFGWQTAYNTTGPVTRAKTNFLKSLLNRYGVTGKFLINTEAALIEGSGSAFDATKSDYIAIVYATALADGLVGNVWYSLEGWRNSNLMDGAGQPLAAYDAYKFAAETLQSAVYQRDVNEFSGLRGFAFDRSNGDVWLLWAPAGGTHVANLPGTPAAIYHTDGTPMSVTTSLSVGFEPLYVVWSP